MSTWLAFDAGSPVTSAAIARGGALLAESSGESRSGPSLLHHIDATLDSAGVRAAELDGILVLSGPGSFTGIRIALATALGFRAGLAVPVVALSNLAALALHAVARGAREASRAPAATGVLALVDALRDEWFVQAFAPVAHGFAASAEPRRQPASEIAAAPGIVFAAHAAQALPHGLAGSPVCRAVALSPEVAIAASAGRLGVLMSADLQPLYLRAFTPRASGP